MSLQQTTSPRRSIIAFIGGGNMASSIIGGLIHSGWSQDQFRVADPLEAQREKLQNEFGIKTFADNASCIEEANVVIFATKPQVLKQVVVPLSETLRQQKPLIISIAAGIQSQHILHWIGDELPCVRVMPNTPALVNYGVSGLFATPLAKEADQQLAQSLMQAVGKVVWVDNEDLIDTVTGVSGSGPAYFFKMMELMMQAGVEHGLDPDKARELVIETARGAAELISQSEHSPAALRRNVTSPGGTTEAGIQFMEKENIDQAITGGVTAAILRSQQLASEFGE